MSFATCSAKGEQGRPGWCRDGTGGMTVDEHNTELALEVPNLERYGGLAQEQLLGGATKAFELDDLSERPKAVEVQPNTPARCALGSMMICTGAISKRCLILTRLLSTIPAEPA